MKARGNRRKGYGNELDECSMELQPFYIPLLDHGALWKLKNNSVICTAMPYGDLESIKSTFDLFIEKFEYPKTIKMEVLDESFHFRNNGDYMICIFCNSLLGDYVYEKSREKAIHYGRVNALRSKTINANYIRDPYVTNYVKQRAKGVCQLCNKPAPFTDTKGMPYLEAHHIVWLKNGGEDTIYNTVALCPNCHRKMHILNLKEDMDKLLNIARKDI